jgi:hypothetical protein
MPKLEQQLKAAYGEGISVKMMKPDVMKIIYSHEPEPVKEDW